MGKIVDQLIFFSPSLSSKKTHPKKSSSEDCRRRPLSYTKTSPSSSSSCTRKNALEIDTFLSSKTVSKPRGKLNYEKAKKHRIGIIVTDSKERYFSKEFNIEILDVNEFPTDIKLSKDSISEHFGKGNLIGKLSTEDPDEGDTFTYALVGDGASGESNDSFVIKGDELRSNEVFDFETKSEHAIRIQTTDKESLTFEKIITIKIFDVNEPPLYLLIDNDIIPEKHPIGSVIGKLSTTDYDKNDAHTYSLVKGDGDDHNALVFLDGDQLKTNSIFDYIPKESYQIRLRTTDKEGESFERIVTLSVSDLKEPTGLILKNVSIREK